MRLNEQNEVYLSTGERADREDFIKGLREMADWYESHVLVPAPSHQIFNLFTHDKALFAALRRAAELSVKTSDENYIMFRKSFGSIDLDVNVSKELTCERVKVGEEVIPAKPARVVELPAEPAKVVEKFEWRCPESILEASRSADAVDADDVSEQQHLRAIGAEQPQWSDA